MSGTIIMPMTRPAASADSEATAKPEGFTGVADEGGNREGGEEAEHHGGHARQDFKHRLQDAAHAPAGILRHVDGREQAKRPGNSDSDEGDEQRANQQRNEAE